jgi:hypothetical protein
MKMGFTGTRDGMSPRQKRQFESIARRFMPSEFHHGDCIGADDEAATIIHKIRSQPPLDIFDIPKIKIVVHPPVDGKYRANNQYGDEIRGELPYLERNANVTYECDMLVAAPKESEEQVRRGTWHTIRQAWKRGKATIILLP